MATLMARYKDPVSGSFKQKKVPQTRGRFVAVAGATSYFTTYKVNGTTKATAGKEFDAAVAEFLNLANGARVGPAPEAPPTAARTRLADAMEKFKVEALALGKAKATAAVYGSAVGDFIASCGREFVDQVTREDWVAYVVWMRENLGQHRVGDQNVTLRNRLRRLTTFALKFKMATLPMKEWPKATKRAPDKYSVETVNKMLAAASEGEKDLILFLLYTGCRDGEAAHAKLSDFDFARGTFRVQDKPEYAWRVKDKEVRDIPLPADFVERMKARHEKRGDGLIFPSATGLPSDHLLRIVRRVAERAGITEHISLHRFRRTFGSMYAKKFGVQTAMKVLGHGDLKTTAAYLAGEDLDSKEARSGVEDLFSGVGD